MSTTTVPSPAAVRGIAAIACLLAIATAAALIVVSRHAPAPRSAADATTRQVLAEAREALLGYAAAYPDRVNADFGPGYLPCPATDLRGIAGPACALASGTTFGRLPWHTLRTNDLRDGAGEGLWYAISASHRNNPKREPLNGATSPTLFVDGRAAVAVIIAPGEALPHQRHRWQLPDAPGQFLEGANADADAARFGHSAVGNDRLAVIDAAAHEEILTARVMADLAAYLRAYAAAHGGHYPWLVPPSDEVLAAPGVTGVRAGWLPVHATALGADAPYAFALAPEWALTGLDVDGDSNLDLVPPDCLQQMPCRTASGAIVAISGQARCLWWAAANATRPPRDYARCEVSAQAEVEGRRFDYRMHFAVVDDDGDVEIDGPSAQRRRTRQLLVTRLGGHAEDPELDLAITLEVSAASGRRTRVQLGLTPATTGHFRLPDLPYAMDADAQELPSWLVRNGWHRTIAVAHAACTSAQPCLSAQFDAPPATHTARAVLVAPAAQSAAPTPEPHGLLRFTPDNRAALTRPERGFVGRNGNAGSGDRIVLVESAP
ncbi:MAG: hypothetical protein WD928_08155 [Gammaproteobacteria bacterium]